MGLLAAQRPLSNRQRLLHGLKRAPPSRLETVQLGHGSGHQIPDPCRNGGLLIDSDMSEPA